MDLGLCEPCPEAHYGTTMFQQFNCESCGDIWHKYQNDPESVELLVSKQVCEDAKSVYNIALHGAAQGSWNGGEIVEDLLKNRPTQLAFVGVEIFGVLLVIFLIAYQCCCIRNRHKVGIAQPPAQTPLTNVEIDSPEKDSLKKNKAVKDKGHTRNDSEIALNSENTTMTGAGDISQRSSNLGLVELPSILNVTALDNTGRLEGSHLEMLQMADQLFDDEGAMKQEIIEEEADAEQSDSASHHYQHRKQQSNNFIEGASN